MENNRKNNLPEIKVCVGSNNTAHVVSATNNKAQYFSDLAKKFRDEAKEYSELAKISAEQNSNVTFEYIDEIKNNLEDEISKKQIQGDYVSRSELPKNVSELENDKLYVTQTTLSESLSELKLPSSDGNEGKFLSTDGENLLWNEVTTFSLFDMVIKDHILSYEESKGYALQGTYVYKEALAGSRYGYPDFYAKCVEEKEAGTATQVTLGGETILMYANSNGHKFYDIADKETVDTWFDTYGIADFYGVDTENERVFLPRNKYFMQLTVDTADVNKMNEAGLPNITGSTGYNLLTDGSIGPASTSALYTAGSYSTGGGGSTFKGRGYSFDASRSNSIYGNSDTVQPPSSSKLLYYVVGTTTSYKGMTNVVNQGMTILEQVSQGLEQVNKGLETKADVDLTNSSIVHIVETYVNDASGYRIYSDGYCEQWGYFEIAANASGTITIPKTYANTKYNLSSNCYAVSEVTYNVGINFQVTGVNTLAYSNANASHVRCVWWKTSGYLAEGEY
jgi:hypothetical protein